MVTMTEQPSNEQERKDFMGMGFAPSAWGVLLVLSIGVAYMAQPEGSMAFTFGAVVGGAAVMLDLPLLVVGLVIMLTRSFGHPAGTSTRRTVFFALWGLMFLGQFPRIFSSGSQNKEAFMEACVLSARAQATPDLETTFNVHKYCECAYEKVLEKRMSLSELSAVKDRNSIAHNEVAAPCVRYAMIGSATSGAVWGTEPVDTIPIVNTQNGFKLKVEVAGEEFYFIFDSGASDPVVSSTLEQKMERAGVIHGYLPEMSYEMANGELMPCKRVIVKNVGIGGFVLDSVVMAVYDGDIQFLLGKSFLDRFSAWRFLDGGEQLLLER